MATITLTGGNAVIAIIVGAIGFGISYTMASADLDQTGEALIQREIYFEYLGYAHAEDEKNGTREVSRQLNGRSDIKIVSLSGRGTRESMIVKVEVEPHPVQPPGTELVRYFQLRHSHLGGWSVWGKSSSFAYYTRLFVPWN